MRLLSKRLVVVNKQLAEAQTQLDRFLDQLGNATPQADVEESAPEQTEQQRDVAILQSLPGVGPVVSATLLAEAYDSLRRRDYHALRCLCGVAPVTRQSGRSRIVTRRLAAHRRLRDIVHQWAGVAMQCDPLCQARYQALRDRGHGHARALRGTRTSKPGGPRGAYVVPDPYAASNRATTNNTGEPLRTLAQSKKTPCRKVKSPTTSRPELPANPVAKGLHGLDTGDHKGRPRANWSTRGRRAERTG